MKNSIDRIIIDKIHLGSRNIVELINEIQQERPKTTKQAVYAAIRNLRSEEVVVTHKKHVSLNTLWVKRQLEFFKLANLEYAHEGGRYDDILAIEDGDRVSFAFHSPDVTDQYWGHILEALVQNTSQATPLIMYNPHEWFLIARRATETELFWGYHESGRLLLLISGGDTTLDKIVLQKEFKAWHHQFYINTKLSYPKNYYLNIIGDYIIEVRLDKKVCEKIENFYMTHQILTETAVQELKDIVSQKGKNRLTIIRNKKKARALRKQLSAQFYVPKEYSLN